MTKNPLIGRVGGEKVRLKTKMFDLVIKVVNKVGGDSEKVRIETEVLKESKALLEDFTEITDAVMTKGSLRTKCDYLDTIRRLQRELDNFVS